MPQLPDDEAHRDVDRAPTRPRSTPPIASCAGCHARIDPFGFALEGFDAIGRRRDKDLGDRPDRRHARSCMDGAEFEGLDGLRDYLLTNARDAVRAPVLPQAAGLCPGPRRAALRRAAARRDAEADLQANELSCRRRDRDDRASRQFREIRGRDDDERRRLTL